MLTDDTIFEDEIMETTKQKTYMDIWQMFALFSILHKPVSVYTDEDKLTLVCAGY